MAKSVGNISRVVDLLESGVSARALRYALISVHYRQGIDYSDASLDAAAAAIDRLDALVAALWRRTARIAPTPPTWRPRSTRRADPVRSGAR